MTEEQVLAEGQELAQSLVGRTITRVLWVDESHGQDWTGHEVARIWLDDGRVIEFGGWGYDAWGATMNEIRAVDVPKCLHCGGEHLGARVCEGWEYQSDHLPRDRAFAWCSDGNHVAMLLEA